jgi:hypothetical protein
MSSNNHYIFFETPEAKNPALKCGHWLNDGIVTQIVPEGAMVLVNGSIPLVDIPRSMLNRNVKDGVWVKWVSGNTMYEASGSLSDARGTEVGGFVLGGRLFVVPPSGILATATAAAITAAKFTTESAFQLESKILQPLIVKKKPARKSRRSQLSGEYKKRRAMTKKK